jgi:protein-disulfide isomerase
MPKAYTDAKCPHCGKDLFSSTPPWEAKKGQKIVVDTCMTHGKVA